MLLLRTSRGVDPGIPLLRSLGSNAHVWLPGANGVTVASLPSNNYLLSDGSTGYSTVDGVDGLTLDGMSSSTTKGAILSGAVGTYLTTPDSAASSITGDIDIRVKAACTDWTPTANMSFASKIEPSGQNAWQFVITSAGGLGKLSLWNSTNGTNLTPNESSVGTGFTDGTTHWVRATRVSATGVVKYYTSEDGSTWTQLGTDIAGSTGDFINSTSIVEIGSSRGGTINPFTGKIYQVQIYNGIAGTLAVEFKATDYSTGTTLTSSTTGEVWTLNGAAYIVPDGTHLTQATTANKPLVRRGMLNLLTYSNNLTNAAWTKVAATVNTSAVLSPDGSTSFTITDDAAASDHKVRQVATVATGTAVTCAVIAKAGTAGYLWAYDGYANVGRHFRLSDGGILGIIGGTPTSSTYADLGNGWGLYTMAYTASTTTRPDIGLSQDGVSLNYSGSGKTIIVDSAGLFHGTWTAAQILAEGGIPTTTTTAASNPSAGKYWWSFDGSNDYLTAGSVPFQINEDHAVIVGYRNQGSSAADYVFGVKADAWRTACGLTVSAGKPGAYWYDGALASEILNATTSYVPVIVTAVKRTNAKQLRVNGAQSGATDNTALSSFTATHAYVGGSSGATASTIDAVYSFDGSISIVIVVKGTLTDAELLLLERFAASVTPGAPVF